MGFLTLSSDNPNFSFAIKKNPETGMQIKKCRRGFMYGWYSDPCSYNIYFREGLNSVSFKRDKHEDFEYINTTRFSSPLFVIQAISEFFRHNTREIVSEDTEGTNTVNINMISVNVPLYLKFFSEQFDNLEVSHAELGPKNFSVTMKSAGTLHRVLNLAQLFAFFVILSNRDYIELNNDIVTKYMECLNALTPPYFMTYLFKKNCLRSRGAFDKEKAVLEQNPLYDSMTLKFGGTLQNRIDAILERTCLDESILDIGCGEGNYIREFSKRNKEVRYIAVDTDEETLERAKKVIRNRNLENVLVSSNLDIVIATGIPENTEVLLTEVIEHMSEQEAQELVNKILGLKNVKSLLITTPNFEFNRFYPMDTKFRHDDHKFEFTQEQWRVFMEQFERYGEVEYFNIGDEVNGIPTSLGAKITRKV